MSKSLIRKLKKFKLTGKEAQASYKTALDEIIETLIKNDKRLKQSEALIIKTRDLAYEVDDSALFKACIDYLKKK